MPHLETFKATLARTHVNLGRALASQPTDPAAPAAAVIALRKTGALIEELKTAGLATEAHLRDAASWKKIADSLEKKP